MGPPSYMRSVVDRNAVMRRVTVLFSGILCDLAWYEFTIGVVVSGCMASHARRP